MNQKYKVPYDDFERPWIAEWGRAIYYIKAWIPVGLMAIYLKFTMMNNGGFLTISRNIGKIQSDLNFVDKLSFFRLDLLLAFVLIPVCLVVLFKVLHPILRAMVSGALCIVASIFFYAQMLSLGNIGRFLSYDLLVDAVSWGIGQPEYIGSYVGFSGLAKLATVLLYVFFAVRWAFRRDVQCFSIRHMKIYVLLVFFGTVAFPLGLIGVSMGSNLKETPYHKNIFSNSLASFMGLDGKGVKEFDKLDEEGLRGKYKAITGAPDHKKYAQYFGKERESDVIFFVFDTAPYKCLSLEGNLDEFRAHKRLISRSFVAYRHYTSYPYTSDAVFTIFSGLYPPSHMKKFIRKNPQMKLPGVIRSLTNKGYMTAVYNSYRSVFEQDQEMFQLLGVKKESIAQELEASKYPKKKIGWDETQSLDVLSKNELKKDITRWIESGQRYLVAYLPQVGHAPWHDLNNYGDNYIARGRAIMELQDRWLNEIIDLLVEHKRIENTVVIVTADHGIRTRLEDPSFPGGMIDDYSFHVPLLIFAPNTVSSTMPITQVTSHIDISPTVLDLLGVENDRRYEQGSPLWEDQASNRTTFFFADGYFGSDGFYKANRYVMHNSISEVVYKNEDMHFDERKMLPNGSEEAKRVTMTLKTMKLIQESWLRQAIMPNSTP